MAKMYRMPIYCQPFPFGGRRLRAPPTAMPHRAEYAFDWIRCAQMHKALGGKIKERQPFIAILAQTVDGLAFGEAEHG